MNIEIKDKKQVFLNYLVIVVAAISLFCFSYNFFKERTIDSQVNYIDNALKEINTINDRCNDFIVKDSINVNKSLKIIPEMVNELNKIKDDINIQEYDPEKLDSLRNGVENNILMYIQMEAMLKNPAGNDIEKAAKNLKTYYTIASNYYSIFSENAISILKSSFFAIDNITNYCLSAFNSTREKEVNDDQNTLFINAMDNISSYYDNLKVDFSPLSLKARNNIITYELAISDIDNQITSLKTLKDSLKNISVPNNGLKSYEELDASMEEYYNYLQNFKYSLSMEKVHAKNEKTDSDFYESLYITPKKHLSSAETHYSKFKSFYKKLKSVPTLI